MPAFETFSKRQKRLAHAGEPEVYQYDLLPREFRVQVVLVWQSAIGRYYVGEYGSASPSNPFWTFIHDKLARERGEFALANRGDASENCGHFLLGTDTHGALDIIELSFTVIDRLVRKLDRYAQEKAHIKDTADEAIEELNHRFREHGIGYEYVDGELVRIDSQLAHAEIVKPALSLLNEQGFEGAEEEFLKGFEHYRQGRNKEAIAEALKAFESTMKSICGLRKWTVPANATAIPLIKTVIENGLVPKEFECEFAGLRSAMESGLPALANRHARHGQGAVPTTIPDHFAAYALHLCASNIVFLVRAHKSLK